MTKFIKFLCQCYILFMWFMFIIVNRNEKLEVININYLINITFRIEFNNALNWSKLRWSNQDSTSETPSYSIVKIQSKNIQKIKMLKIALAWRKCSQINSSFSIYRTLSTTFLCILCWSSPLLIMMLITLFTLLSLYRCLTKSWIILDSETWEPIGNLRDVKNLEL